jgi:hypothetical protein
MLNLREIDADSDFPSYFPPGEGLRFPYGQLIINVIVEQFRGTLMTAHIVFEDQRVMTSELWEGQSALVLRSKLEFIAEHLAYLTPDSRLLDLWSQMEVDLPGLLN